MICGEKFRSSPWNGDSMGGGSRFPLLTSALSSSWSPSDVSSLKAGGLGGEVMLREDDAPYNWTFCGTADVRTSFSLMPRWGGLAWGLWKGILIVKHAQSASREPGFKSQHHMVAHSPLELELQRIQRVLLTSTGTRHVVHKHSCSENK